MKLSLRIALLVPLVALLAASAARAQDRPYLVLDSGGHTAIVKEVLFTSDDREVITVGDDKTIRFWDVATGEPLRTLRVPIGLGPEGSLNCAALSPNGQRLAVAGLEEFTGPSSIYLIDLAAGKIERRMPGHASSISALAFNRDGTRLVSAGYDQSARVWNVETGETLRILTGHTHTIGDIAMSPTGDRIATASQDGTARVWDVATGKCLAILAGHTGFVLSIDWSPDGATIATGGQDLTVRLWNPPPLRAVAAPPRLTARQTIRIEQWVMSLNFTRDSRELLLTTASVGQNTEIAGMLSLATGKIRTKIGHTNTAHCGALSHNGALAASSGGADGEILLWSTRDGGLIWTLVGRGRNPWSAAWSRDGRSVVWGNTAIHGEINAARPLERAFDLGRLEFALPPRDADVVRAQSRRGPLSLKANGDYSLSVAGAAQPVTIKLDRSNQGMLRSFTFFQGDRVVLGADFMVQLYDARTGGWLRDLIGASGVTWALAPSPDGRYLLAASGDQVLRVWNADRAVPLLSLFVAGDEWVAWTYEGYYACSPNGERLFGWHVNRGLDQLADYYPAAKFRATLYRPDVIARVIEAGSVEKALALAAADGGGVATKTSVTQVLPPTAVITSPVGPKFAAPSDTVTIRATAKPTGKNAISRMLLLVDSRPWEGKAGERKFDAAAAPQPREAEWSVKLEPGKHRVQVLVDSPVSQGNSDELEISFAGGGELSGVELPALYVAAFGISGYPGNLRLNYAAADAERLKTTFETNSRGLYRKVEVRADVDAQATRANMLKGVSWLKEQMTQRDVGIFFFAGHGKMDAEGTLYFLPVDGDEKELLASAVPADQLTAALRGVRGRMMVMLDACHAGGVNIEEKQSRAGPIRRERDLLLAQFGVFSPFAVSLLQAEGEPPLGNSLTDDLVRDLVTDENGLIVMCSSTGRESSLENNEHRQGNFTLALCEGLAGKADYNKDGVVYLNELDTYVSDRVKQLTRGQQHPTTGKPPSIRSFPLAKP